MRTVPLIAAALLLAASPLVAQESKTAAKLPVTSDITKEQEARAKAAFADFDARVMAGFKGDEKLVAAMQADLKIIDTQKDPKARSAAIAAYQKKYAEPYKTAMKKGGADLNGLAATLSQIFKGQTFKVVNGTHLVAVTDSGETPPAPPMPPAKQTINLVSNDFAFQGDTDCGGVRDSDASYGNFRLTTRTWAGLVGGCKETGTIAYGFNGLEGLSPTARVKFDLTADASAIALTGAAWSRTSTSLTLRSGNTLAVSRSLTVDVAAAILWAAEDDGILQNAVMTLTSGTGKRMDVLSSSISRANAIGSVVTGTEASSSLKIHEASIVANP
ncbi:hypothetical protein [Asticcacaulis sp. YBE204]|uniref:hypothetical protein n=1 Tax=Asticcacaulis sp. YBE204 TaxID=1282363 RepID=UPI0003C3B752|nr:hypothetical protein [Asticcacaulis sp. YBE204]ESQ78363.1 hypothetical protein AEYBE204_14420 [Asticcacaulis sp. YBE204]